MSKITCEEVSGESEYIAMTDEDVKSCALGMLAGSVFGTWAIREPDMISMVFMPLAFLEDIARKKMLRDGVIHFFEDMSKAGPRSINGYPIFMSMRCMNQSDWDRVCDKIKQIEAI